MTVSVITYQDGRQELEVLHTGPPHPDEEAIDRRKFAGQSGATQGGTLPIASPADLQNAMNLIRATLWNAATA